MIIDTHQHITDRDFPEFSNLGHGPFDGGHLVEDMDKWGIDKSVVLPLANPENLDFFGVASNQEVIRECRRYPDRLIPFCNVDPRAMLHTPKADLSKLLHVYKDLGCVGIGEVCANISITSPLYQNLFHHAGEMGMPMLFHISHKKGELYGTIDKQGLPGLEASLKRFPKAIFIGHAMAFWNEIDGDLRPCDRGDYPSGPIHREGPLWRLMRDYPNLYADFSAGSGLNALTRDMGRCVEFLTEFNKKVLFGTDDFFKKDNPPGQLPMMQTLLSEKKISKSTYENIMHRNFKRLFPTVQY